MIGSTYSSRPRFDSSEGLRLSSTESFRLFGEGLLALSKFEKGAGRPAVDSAEQFLKDCTSKYPQDVLPRFYLGIVESYLGEMNQTQAIECFHRVLASGEESLRLAARYNLAVAHIQQQTVEGFEQAQTILQETLAELRSISEKHGVSELLLQTWVDFLFVTVRQTLWRELTKTIIEESEKPKIRARIVDFDREFNQFKKVMKGNRRNVTNQLRADSYNVEGLYKESYAWLLKGEGKGASSKEYAIQAVQLYEESATERVNWASPRANAARVYYELLDEAEKAVAIWEELTHGVEEVEYSHYCLGRYFFEKKEDCNKAISHFKLAPDISKAWLFMARIYRDGFKVPEAARVAWETVKERWPNNKEAVREAEEGLKSVLPQSDLGSSI